MKKNKISDKVFLLHISESIERIEKFTRNVTQEKFMQEEKTQDATIRRIEIIGEATKNLSKTFKNKHPEIKWAKIISMRNVIVHEYFGIDLKRTYKIVKEDISDLKNKISKILEDLKVNKLI